MRRLAPLILLLSLAASAPAATVTGYALGRVTRDLAEGVGVPRTFAVGEAVEVRWTYDLEPTDPLWVWGGNPAVIFEISTAGGFEHRSGFASVSAVVADGDVFRLLAAYDPRSIDLRLDAGTGAGTLEFAADLPLGQWGFRATVEAGVTLPAPLHAPEPPGLLMMLTGGVALVTIAAGRGGSARLRA